MDINGYKIDILSIFYRYVRTGRDLSVLEIPINIYKNKKIYLIIEI